MFYTLILAFLIAFVTGGTVNLMDRTVLYITGGVLALLTARRWLKSSPNLSLLSVSAVLFCIWGLVEYYSAPVSKPPRSDLMLLIFYTITGFATLQLTLKERTRFLYCLVAVILLNAGLIVGEEILQTTLTITSRGLIPSQTPGRYAGVLLNPNAAGVLSVVGLVFLIRWAITVTASKKQLILQALTLFLLLESVLATQSRSALALGVLIGILMPIILWWRSKNKQALIFAVLSACFLCLAFPCHHTLMARVRDVTKTTITEPTQINTGENQRLAIWKASLQLWEKNPIMGIHPGLLNDRWFEVQPRTIQLLPEKSHSFLITAACEYGVVGLALVLGTLVLWGRQLRKSQLTPSQKAAAISVVVLLLSELLDYSFYSPMQGMLFVCLAFFSLPIKELYSHERRCIIASYGVLVLFFLAQLPGVCSVAYYITGADKLPLEARIMRVKAATVSVPDNADLHLMLADLYAQEGKGADSIREQAKVMQLNPYKLDRLSIATALIHTDPTTSSNILQSVLQQAPNYFRTWEAAENYYNEAGDLQKANWCHTNAIVLKVYFSGGFKH